jgi:pimeloyl-ACP methyl ester carboxylesterase
MAFLRETIEINGCKLSFARGGAGEPLIYLHGTDGLAEWPTILDTLAERFDVIVPDHPGFGASEVPAWIDDVSDVAYLYLDAIAKLGLSGIHVVGQSLGGWIALEMAVRSTQHLRSLTLISAAGIHVKGVPKTDIFMIDPEEQARLAYADPRIGDEAAQRVGADKYQDLAILNRIASARFGWQPRFFNPRLERWLHRVNVPTHVIWGEADRIIPPAYGEAFHRLIPGSTLTMIPNAGHLPHVERAGAVAQAMQTFLRN